MPWYWSWVCLCVCVCVVVFPQINCLLNSYWGQRSLEGCSPWGRWGPDTTERLHFHFSLSCVGEGNGNPLQCSCLENPRDEGAWWAAVYGVTQSRTQLKWLSSSMKTKSCYQISDFYLDQDFLCLTGRNIPGHIRRDKLECLLFANA